MQTLVLVQRFRGRLTDVGPGVLVMELSADGAPVGIGDVTPSAHGVRNGTAIAVIFVMEEER